jgi:methylphosphotriester-DNA--protein-cysteine methyltransferase
MPDGAYYKNVKAEVLFKTEKEAKEAGFRKSKR